MANFNNVKWLEPDDAGWMNVGFKHQASDNTITAVYSQDVSKIVSSNKRRQLEEDNARRRASGELYQVAEVPLGVVMKWRNELGVDIHDPNDWQKVKELLHDPDWKDALRVDDTNFLTHKPRQHFSMAPRLGNELRGGSAKRYY